MKKTKKGRKKSKKKKSKKMFRRGITLHTPIPPKVRSLYRAALHVGKDYPHPEGLDYVRRAWKDGIRNGEKGAKGMIYGR